MRVIFSPDVVIKKRASLRCFVSRKHPPEFDAIILTVYQAPYFEDLGWSNAKTDPFASLGPCLF